MIIQGILPVKPWAKHKVSGTGFANDGKYHNGKENKKVRTINVSINTNLIMEAKLKSLRSINTKVSFFQSKLAQSYLKSIQPCLNNNNEKHNGITITVFSV